MNESTNEQRNSWTFDKLSPFKAQFFNRTYLLTPMTNEESVSFSKALMLSEVTKDQFRFLKIYFSNNNQLRSSATVIIDHRKKVQQLTFQKLILLEDKNL